MDDTSGGSFGRYGGDLPGQASTPISEGGRRGMLRRISDLVAGDGQENRSLDQALSARIHGLEIRNPPQTAATALISPAVAATAASAVESPGRMAARVAIRAFASAAHGAALAGRSEEAWRMIVEAEGIELEELRDDADIVAYAAALCERARLKLPPSEQAWILQLLGGVTREEPAGAEPAAKAAAMRVRRSILVETYKLFEEWQIRRKLDRVRVGSRVLWLTVILFLQLGGLAYLLVAAPELVTQLYAKTTPVWGLTHVWLTFLLGGIGACLSALLTFTLQRRIPDESEGIVVTLARPAVGATSGLVAVLLANAGLVTFTNPVASFAALAFVFGFSERLVIGAVDRFEGTQSMKAK